MALAAAAHRRLDGVGKPTHPHGGDLMKRALFILLGLMLAMTVFGLMFAFTRPIKWPADIAAPAWRKAFGEKVEEPIEEAGA
jgi:hypothetical protein